MDEIQSRAIPNIAFGLEEPAASTFSVMPCKLYIATSKKH
jgi:hypothetical protein